MEIEQLKQEIYDYENELKSLRAELNTKSAVAPQPTSGHPSEISAGFRSAAIATAEKLTDIEGIKSAIAELELRLAQKRSQFQLLYEEQKKQTKIQRVAEGQEKIRAKCADVEQAAESLRLLFDELKKLSDEYQSDFSELYPASSGEKILNIANLLNFETLTIPSLTEKQGRFILSSTNFDVFAAEKAEQQKAQAQRARQAKAATDALIVASQQKKIAEKQQRERERLEEVLSAKRTELCEAETLHAKYMQQVHRGVKLDLSKINSFIALTNLEIEQLQNELDGIGKTDVAI